MKKTVKISFMVDDEQELSNRLNRYYNLEIVSSNPDFAFCSANYKYEFIHKYDCVRIFLTGENIRPDFNLFDYAIGFDKTLHFEDRNFYYPQFLSNSQQLKKSIDRPKRPKEDFLSRNKFCNFIVSNAKAADPVRDHLLDTISAYKKVDSAGRYRNNMPDGKNVADKLSFMEGYRFSLVPENSSFPGYTTEKIIDAFAAGTIPIYWGDPRVEEQFNKDAFINVMNYQSDAELIERIREIDENEELYLKMLQTPILNPDGNVLNMMEESYLDEYLCHILDQDSKDALRRINYKYGWGQFEERDANYFYEMMNNKAITTLYRIIRHLR